MPYSHFAAWSLLTVLALFPASADVLGLSTGETFSGRLIRVTEGSLVFRTSLQGQMMVSMENVASLSSEGQYVVTFADESVRYGRFLTEEGEARLKLIDGDQPLPITLGAIKEATPLPSSSPPETPTAPALRERRASAELGMQARSGKEHALEPYVRLEASQAREGSLVGGTLSVERSAPDDFPAWLRGDLFWRDYADRTWGPYAGLSVERNEEGALRLRTGLHLGVGRVLHQFHAPDSPLFEGLLGLNIVYETWESTPGAPWLNDEESGTGLEAQLGLRYGRAFGRGTLSSTLNLFPSLGEGGEFRAASETALSWPFNERLRLKLHVLLDYESDPALADVDRWSTGVGASVQFDF